MGDVILNFVLCVCVVILLCVFGVWYCLLCGCVVMCVVSLCGEVCGVCGCVCGNVCERCGVLRVIGEVMGEVIVCDGCVDDG